MQKRILQRPVDNTKDHNLHHLNPVLQRIYLARNISNTTQLDHTLSKLPPPSMLSGMAKMVDHLIDAVVNQRKILVVADFDADGATSCTVAIKGLRLLGLSNVSYIVPNRFEHGYGLTPELVDAARSQDPELLITVDNGISNLDGVDSALELGWKVLITDHHLPGDSLPNAHAIVNPNLDDDPFPCKSLAGVGVMFYVLMGLRAGLRDIDWFSQAGLKEPNLAQLLDFVALGTIADVVCFDHVNRILVQQGLQRIRADRTHPGIRALLRAANLSASGIVPSDMAFKVAPRLNAAGRLDDMSLGIECLLADDDEKAQTLADKLNELNIERRDIERQMKMEALDLMKKISFGDNLENVSGICLFDQGWHQGVIGILASRIKERFQRPVVAFAPGSDKELKGSARSVAGVHIRDALYEISIKHPGLMNKFGGHAMAAGLTLNTKNLDRFSSAFDECVAGHLNSTERIQTYWTDGELADQLIALDFAEDLRKAAPWGQGFPEPLFEGCFEVVQSRVLKDQYLKMVLKLPISGNLIDAIAFNVEQPENWLRCESIEIVYRLDVNEYRNNRNVQLIIEYIAKAKAETASNVRE